MNNGKELMTVLAATLVAAGPAFARSTTEYTDAAAFNTAVSAATNYNFDGIAPTGGFVNVAPTIAGVSFSSSAIPFVYSSLGTDYGGASFFSSENFYAGPVSGIGSTLGPSNVLVKLAGTNAISFTYGSHARTPGSPITITLDNGDTFTQNLPPIAGVDTNFVGFVSKTPITSITFSTLPTTSGSYALDVVNFSLATPVAAVPEPETHSMMLAGLGMMVGIITRRRVYGWSGRPHA